MFIYRHLGGFNEARIDIIRGEGGIEPHFENRIS
jgi:hypothetical protein